MCALLLLFLTLGFSACNDAPFVRGPFGFGTREFAGILARNERGRVLALASEALDDPGSRGAASWLYTGLWLEKGEAAPGEVADATRRLITGLYFRAAQNGQGFIREEAESRLLRLLGEAAREARTGAEPVAAWESILDHPAIKGRDNSDLGLLRLEALSRLGRDEELRSEAAEFAQAWPEAASKHGDALLYFEAQSARRLGIQTWHETLERLLALPPSEWTSKGIDLAVEASKEAPEGPSPGKAILASAVLRRFIDDRDYGNAWWQATSIAPLLGSAEANRDLVAAAGKAALYSGMAAGGLDLMERIGANKALSSAPGGREWTAAFYRARMLESLGRDAEAASEFSALAAKATAVVDRDSALWYWVDCATRNLDKNSADRRAWSGDHARGSALRRGRLSILVEASHDWSEPKAFEDLAAPLLRESVLEADWDLIDDFSTELSGRLRPQLAARSLYLAGRIQELGLADSGAARPPFVDRAAGMDGSELGPAAPRAGLVAASRYEAVLSMATASEYYRLLAAARLGRDLSLVPSVPVRDARKAASPVDLTGGSAAFANDLEGLIDFGLPAEAWPLASARLEFLEGGDLRRIAATFARAGRWSDSMLFAGALIERGEKPEKRDFELLYPRPWLSEMRAGIGAGGLPEYAALALIRSESYFRPDVKSHAGAVGLAQLMPATAAEMAGKLKLKDWSLADPAINIRLGLLMFRDLVKENDGKILRALFAYNAGRTRLRRWAAEAGPMPDDLFLESLSIDETRQYGRKIVTAGAWYGFLYYGRGSASTVGELIGGIVLPGK